jgi:hypothetical protein
MESSTMPVKMLSPSWSAASFHPPGPSAGRYLSAIRSRTVNPDGRSGSKKYCSVKRS